MPLCIYKSIYKREPKGLKNLLHASMLKWEKKCKGYDIQRKSSMSNCSVKWGKGQRIQKNTHKKFIKFLEGSNSYEDAFKWDGVWRTFV